MKNTGSKGNSHGMSGTEKGVLVGAGVAALAAAVAGGYYLYGSNNAAKHRKQVKSWMLKAKAEVLEQIESLPEVTEEIYKRVVSEVVGRYKDLKNVQGVEIKELNDELESHWGNIKKEIGKVIMASVRPAAKSAGKMIKSSCKSTTKKGRISGGGNSRSGKK